MQEKAFVILLMVMIPQTAYAYVDPGTGSMLLQVLLAGFLAGIFAIKRFWHQLRSKLSKNGSENENKAETQEESK